MEGSHTAVVVAIVQIGSNWNITSVLTNCYFGTGNRDEDAAESSCTKNKRLQSSHIEEILTILLVLRDGD